MAQHILLHIEGKGKDHEDENKTLYYADGTVEIRSPQWVLIETQNLGKDLTLLDMEDMFDKIYEDVTPHAKAKLLKKRAKEKAQLAGDLAALEALEEAEQNYEEILPEEDEISYLDEEDSSEDELPTEDEELSA